MFEQIDLAFEPLLHKLVLDLQLDLLWNGKSFMEILVAEEERLDFLHSSPDITQELRTL